MPKTAPIYVWRKLVTPAWLEANEGKVQETSGDSCAVIERPTRQRLLLEVASVDRSQIENLQERFGGRSEQLSRDWLNEMLRAKSSKPIRIGQRLIVTSEERAADAGYLFIPAGAAFGTGEHATTAMSLRLLERVTRHLPNGWRMLDAGTGSGILALAGRRFGAGEVLAVENNPLALSVAKENARQNQIRGIRFIEGEVADHLASRFDLIAANLYSELLAVLMPRFAAALASAGKLILSGVMRRQEAEVLRALRSSGLAAAEIRRRGKWIALLAQKRG